MTILSIIIIKIITTIITSTILTIKIPQTITLICLISWTKKKKDTIIDDKYEIYPSTFLTKGSKTIDIVAGGDIIEPSKKYAIKFENENNINILKKEIILYDYLKSTDGFPTLYSNGNFHNQNYIILERLGPNLKELFKYCNNHFSLQTILLIGIQIITRLQDFHYKTGFIYNNIKLSNFCVGLKDTNKIYVIDLSKAKPFRYSDYQMNRYEHIPYNENTDYINITKFSSKNSQIGIEISRRDDLESLGYMLIYFANEGKLPWLINKNVVINNNNNNNNENNIDDNNNNNNKENNNNNKNNNNNNNNNNNIHNITKEEKKLFYIENKLSSTIEEFCKNLPIEFSMYMNYIENLGFYEKPDYNYLKGLFGNLLFTFYIEKFYFDWNILSPKEIPNNLRTNKELENKYEYLSSKYYYDNINPESKKKKKKKKKKKTKIIIIITIMKMTKKKKKKKSTKKNSMNFTQIFNLIIKIKSTKKIIKLIPKKMKMMSPSMKNSKKNSKILSIKKLF